MDAIVYFYDICTFAVLVELITSESITANNL